MIAFEWPAPCDSCGDMTSEADAGEAHDRQSCDGSHVSCSLLCLRCTEGPDPDELYDKQRDDALTEGW